MAGKEEQKQGQREIHRQVHLPISVAFEVVMQGIRIRLGRSIVTLMGVALGIAFLMAILSGQSIRKAVAQETALRLDVARMVSFIVAETGPLRDRDLAVVPAGPLNEPERRLLAAVVKDGAASLRVDSTRAGVLSDLPAAAQGKIQMVPASELARGVSAAIIVGQGAVPVLDWTATMTEARQKVVAVSRKSHGKPAVQDNLKIVALERDLRPDELKLQQEKQRREKFRTTWIVIVSLLVTVIGISNAMLMSVTERFREIGTMKCLGALSAFIRQVFFLEAGLLGLVGSLSGALLGWIFSVIAFSFSFGPILVMGSLQWSILLLYMLGSVVAGVALSVVAAIYPASFAARMVPADALRSTI